MNIFKSNKKQEPKPLSELELILKLQDDALGASASTTNARNSVASKKSLKAKSSTSDTSSTVQVRKLIQSLINATERYAYRVSLDCVSSINPSIVKIHHTNIYEALSHNEAIGMATVEVLTKYSDCNVCLHSVRAIKTCKPISK